MTVDHGRDGPGAGDAGAGEVWVAVADLHGHRRHLRALVEHLDRELGDAYRLCTLGDYVDNGEEVPGLLDDLIELKTARGDRFVPILGNHDLALLRTLGWPGGTPDPEWYAHWAGRYWDPRQGTPEVYAKHLEAATPCSAEAFAALFPRRHREFLESLPWFHDTGTWLFVHAGMEPGPLAPQLESLAANRLPRGHLHLPTQIREKDLSLFGDPGWDRVVVSAHNRDVDIPAHVGPNRICLCADVGDGEVVRAVILPARRWVAVGPDLRVTVEGD